MYMLNGIPKHKLSERSELVRLRENILNKVHIVHWGANGIQLLGRKGKILREDFALLPTLSNARKQTFFFKGSFQIWYPHDIPGLPWRQACQRQMSLHRQHCQSLCQLQLDQLSGQHFCCHSRPIVKHTV